MAATSTAINACDIVASLDNAGGTLQDISGSSNEVSMNFSNEIGEFKPFGTDWKVRLDCGKDAEVTLKVAYTQATNEGMDILKNWFFGAGGARSFRVDVPSASTGGDRYEFEAVLESLDIPLKADDANPIMVEAKLLPTGAVTRSTIP